MAYLLIPIGEFLERELQLIQFSLYNSTLYLQNIHHDESLKFLVGMQPHRLN